MFIVNAMTQPGETDEFTAYDHLRTFLEMTRLSSVDAVIVNTKMPSGDILKKYLEQGQEPVTPDIAKIAKEGVRVFAEDLIGDRDSFVRHDPDRLTELIVKIVRNEIFSEL